VRSATTTSVIHHGHLRCRLTARTDGALVLMPQGELAFHPARITDWLVQWAARTPDRVLVAQRGPDGQWCTVTYSAALRRVRSIGSALLRLDLSPDRPVAILSGNGIEHLLLALAAMYVGVPYAPVSPSYSRSDGGLDKLRHALDLLTPGLIAAFGEGAWGQSLELPRCRAAERISTLEALDATCDPGAADEAHAQVGADSIAKFLLTSGSTGIPKAVVTTQRMLASSQAMIHQALPFLSEEPPVLVDWLPWNHVFGGSHNVGIALMHGGSLYIDEGSPTPAGMERTVRNLGEVSPTIYFSVPRGFDALVPHLRANARLRESFFRRLRANFYAGAGISQPTWDALDELSVQTIGRKTPMITGFGATETAPSLTFTSGTRAAGHIGLPVCGTVVKLAPAEGKLELRVRGPNVMPGYWRQPELTAAAFDEEGFYRLGDAVRLTDTADGLLFDGRLAEDFKLSSGTWVSVGPMRAKLIAALFPLVQDIVLAGLNQPYLGALMFLDCGGCSQWLGESGAGASLAALVRNPALRAEILRRLTAFAEAHPASSTRVERALLLTSGPSPAAGEVTDKGTINQRAVLRSRSADVDALYGPAPGAEVLSARPA
jgi:feruloyl-CoA synthase